MTEPKTKEPKLTGLALLRAPFPENLISKLPKPTKAQTDAIKADFKSGIRCKICGGWHHKDVIHLDYVGHAALTHRLLDADEAWSWEPASLDERGLPAFDKAGGLWIKLTVCGVTRLGYGNADSKPNADAGAREKEVIGDALRNAAMRFGAALDLWHKGDLHAEPEAEDEAEDEPAQETPKPASKGPSRELFTALQKGLRAQRGAAALRKWADNFKDDIKKLPADWADEIRAEYKKELNAALDLELSEEQSHADQ